MATTLARLHEQNLAFVRLEPTNLPTSVGRGYKTLIYKAGGTLVYDAHALVEEVAEPQRVNLAYIKKLNTRIGHTHYDYLWSKQSGIAFVNTGFFVLAQIAGYGLLTVVSFPFGKDRYMKWYVKYVRNVVKLKTAIAGGGKPVELYGNH